MLKIHCLGFLYFFLYFFLKKIFKKNKGLKLEYDNNHVKFYKGHRDIIGVL